MDQSTYKQLTGKTVTDSDRFDALVQVAQSRLERTLGWPLSPDDWANQYIEIGKTRGDCSCSDVDTSDLDDPDPVVGSYRLYSWEPLNRYLAIDPATKIHAVKLVRDGITHKTLSAAEYSPRWINDGDTPYARYLALDRHVCALSGCICQDEFVQVAIDADWGFEDLPAELLQIWADSVTNGLDPSSNIKSESLGSHSYTKFDNGDPFVTYRDTLLAYAGPNSRLYNSVRIV